MSVSADSIAVQGCAPMSDPPSRQANRAAGVHSAALPTGVCMSTTATRPPGRVRAGETIGEMVLAVKHGMRTHDLTGAAHPYPIYNDGPPNASIAEVRSQLVRPASVSADRRVGPVAPIAGPDVHRLTLPTFLSFPGRFPARHRVSALKVTGFPDTRISEEQRI